MPKKETFDEPTMSDATILVTVEDLIDRAMGASDANIVNFKLIQAILHILARQQRMLTQRVEIRIVELKEGRRVGGESSESSVEPPARGKPAKSPQRTVDKGAKARDTGDKQVLRKTGKTPEQARYGTKQTHMMVNKVEEEEEESDKYITPKDTKKQERAEKMLSKDKEKLTKTQKDKDALDQLKAEEPQRHELTDKKTKKQEVLRGDKEKITENLTEESETDQHKGYKSMFEKEKQKSAKKVPQIEKELEENEIRQQVSYDKMPEKEKKKKKAIIPETDKEDSGQNEVEQRIVRPEKEKWRSENTKRISQIENDESEEFENEQHIRYEMPVKDKKWSERTNAERDSEEDEIRIRKRYEKVPKIDKTQIEKAKTLPQLQSNEEYEIEQPKGYEQMTQKRDRIEKVPRTDESKEYETQQHKRYEVMPLRDKKVSMRAESMPLAETEESEKDEILQRQEYDRISKKEKSRKERKKPMPQTGRVESEEYGIEQRREYEALPQKEKKKTSERAKSIPLAETEESDDDEVIQQQEYKKMTEKELRRKNKVKPLPQTVKEESEQSEENENEQWKGNAMPQKEKKNIEKAKMLSSSESEESEEYDVEERKGFKGMPKKLKKSIESGKRVPYVESDEYEIKKTKGDEVLARKEKKRSERAKMLPLSEREESDIDVIVQEKAYEKMPYIEKRRDRGRKMPHTEKKQTEELSTRQREENEKLHPIDSSHSSLRENSRGEKGRQEYGNMQVRGFQEVHEKDKKRLQRAKTTPHTVSEESETDLWEQYEKVPRIAKNRSEQPKSLAIKENAEESEDSAPEQRMWWENTPRKETRKGERLKSVIKNTRDESEESETGQRMWWEKIPEKEIKKDKRPKSMIQKRRDESEGSETEQRMWQVQKEVKGPKQVNTTLQTETEEPECCKHKKVCETMTEKEKQRIEKPKSILQIDKDESEEHEEYDIEPCIHYEKMLEKEKKRSDKDKIRLPTESEDSEEYKRQTEYFKSSERDYKKSESTKIIPKKEIDELGDDKHRIQYKKMPKKSKDIIFGKAAPMLQKEREDYDSDERNRYEEKAESRKKDKAKLKSGVELEEHKRYERMPEKLKKSVESGKMAPRIESDESENYEIEVQKGEVRKEKIPKTRFERAEEISQIEEEESEESEFEHLKDYDKMTKREEKGQVKAKLMPKIEREVEIEQQEKHKFKTDKKVRQRVRSLRESDESDKYEERQEYEIMPDKERIRSGRAKTLPQKEIKEYHDKAEHQNIYEKGMKREGAKIIPQFERQTLEMHEVEQRQKGIDKGRRQEVVKTSSEIVESSSEDYDIDQQKVFIKMTEKESGKQGKVKIFPSKKQEKSKSIYQKEISEEYEQQIDFDKVSEEGQSEAERVEPLPRKLKEESGEYYAEKRKGYEKRPEKEKIRSEKFKPIPLDREESDLSVIEHQKRHDKIREKDKRDSVRTGAMPQIEKTLPEGENELRKREKMAERRVEKSKTKSPVERTESEESDSYEIDKRKKYETIPETKKRRQEKAKSISPEEYEQRLDYEKMPEKDQTKSIRAKALPDQDIEHELEQGKIYEKVPKKEGKKQTETTYQKFREEEYEIENQKGHETKSEKEKRKSEKAKRMPSGEREELDEDDMEHQQGYKEILHKEERKRERSKPIPSDKEESDLSVIEHQKRSDKDKGASLKAGALPQIKKTQLEGEIELQKREKMPEKRVEKSKIKALVERTESEVSEEYEIDKRKRHETIPETKKRRQEKAKSISQEEQPEEYEQRIDYEKMPEKDQTKSLRAKALSDQDIEHELEQGKLYEKVPKKEGKKQTETTYQKFREEENEIENQKGHEIKSEKEKRKSEKAKRMPSEEREELDEDDMEHQQGYKEILHKKERKREKSKPIHSDKEVSDLSVIEKSKAQVEKDELVEYETEVNVPQKERQKSKAGEAKKIREDYEKTERQPQKETDRLKGGETEEKKDKTLREEKERKHDRVEKAPETAYQKETERSTINKSGKEKKGDYIEKKPQKEKEMINIQENKQLTTKPKEKGGIIGEEKQAHEKAEPVSEKEEKKSLKKFEKTTPKEINLETEKKREQDNVTKIKPTMEKESSEKKEKKSHEKYEKVSKGKEKETLESEEIKPERHGQQKSKTDKERLPLKEQILDRKEPAKRSRYNIEITEKIVDNEKILVVEKGPHTDNRSSSSIDVVTQSQFALLESAVQHLMKLAAPLNLQLPDNKQLMSDVMSGAATLPDAMETLQISARLRAAENAMVRMAGLMTQLAVAGELPDEIAETLEALEPALADAQARAGELHPQDVADKSLPLTTKKSVAIEPLKARSKTSKISKGIEAEPYAADGTTPDLSVASRPSTVSRASRVTTTTAGRGVPCVTYDEMKAALKDLRDEIIKLLNTMSGKAATSAETALHTAKLVAEKLDIALKLDDRISFLHSIVNDYAEQLNGFDSGLTTQMQSFQDQMAQIRTDLQAGLLQLENINNNAETAAVMELTERYDELALELDTTLHEHKALTTLQTELSAEMRSLVECMEMLREQKADRDEVLDGLRDKADSSKLAGLLTEAEFAEARADFERRINLCYDKFNRQDQVWQVAIKELKQAADKKAELVELLAARDEAQRALQDLNDKIRTLAAVLGEPKAALLTRKLAEGAACGACHEKALMEPYEAAHGKPHKLAALRPPPVGAPEEPCLADWGAAGAVEERHICHRWCGGSHTLVGDNTRRAEAAPAPQHSASRKHVGYGDDGRLYKMEEECQPCIECNLQREMTSLSAAPPSGAGDVASEPQTAPPSDFNN